MSAGEVMERIKRTARTPEAGPNLATGYGIVDPVAALTYQLPPADQLPDPQTGRPIDGPPVPDPASMMARNIVLGVVGLSIAAAAIALAVIKRPARQRSSAGSTRSGR